ncbi:MAG TPA: hemolysin family protein [Spirochaetota bacterium]|mgnify:CR=1 FL=1|nr:HlyC/CorC family transporter [Spirochaetota bacterium]HQO40513.1 hemolysin family protein [Spirochaetota bacterium]
MLTTFTAVVIIFIMIIFNGFFSMSEMAVVSSRRSRLRGKADNGHPGYKAVLDTARDPGSFLSGIQIGITLIGILAGAFGEATVSDNIESYFINIPLIGNYAKIISVGIVVIAVTTFSIILGELVPKRIALTNPERIASVLIYPVRTISWMLLPLVKLFTAITDLFMYILPFKPAVEPPVSEEEIKSMIREGEEFGLFRREQRDMVEAIFELHETRLSLIMTARPDIVFIEIKDSLKKVREIITANSEYLYLPVCRNGIDNVIGVVKISRVLRQILKGDLKTINSHIEKPLFVPSGTSPLRVLELFKSGRTRIAFIIDEYGGVMGLVTLEDIIEEIVGKVPFLHRTGEPEIIRRKDGSFLVDGLIPIDEFFEKFPAAAEGVHDYNTLAGFLINKTGHIPATGDIIRYRSLSFEIVDMEGNRIDKVIIKKI